MENTTFCAFLGVKKEQFSGVVDCKWVGCHLPTTWDAFLPTKLIASWEILSQSFTRNLKESITLCHTCYNDKKHRTQCRTGLVSSAWYASIIFSFGILATVEAPDPKASATRKNVGRRSYDAVVYSVGSALVVVIILAFLRGFYRLKLDRKRLVRTTQ